MRFKFTTILLLLLPFLAAAQPVLRHAEDFQPGTRLIFRNCKSTGVYPWSTGPSHTWDYSTLTLNPDSTVELMVDPAATTHGKKFPNANLVEKYNDGSFVYMRKTATENYLLGYVDTTQGLEIVYPRSARFMVRPFTYTTALADTFTDKFSANGYDFRGQGVMSIKADGYGTLKLPNGTFDNVLRIKISQVSHDTLIPIGTVVTTANTTWVWFDTTHTSALLKIDSSYTGFGVTKNVSYLLEELTTGIDNTAHPEQSLIKASINNDLLIIEGLKREEKYEANLYNINGQVILKTHFRADGKEISLPIPAGTESGIYILTLQSLSGTEKQLISRKLIKH